MKRQLLCALGLYALISGTCATAQQAPDDSVGTTGVIRQVTLYRDRALVTREISAPEGTSLRSIDVMDLPELVIPESIYAEGDEETTVRAVRISTRPVAEAQRAEVRELDDQIAEQTRQRADVRQQLDVVAANLDSLSQMIRFSSGATTRM